jgi:tetratricopeptide (TPR) repeat protein
MIRFLLITAFAFVSTLSSAQSLQELYGNAQQARKSGDAAGFYDNITKAHKQHPYHQGILYQCGIAAALNGKTEEAVSYLKQAIQINAQIDLNIDELKSLAGLDQLKALQVELQKPIINSATAFIIPEKTFHIESIAKGESDNVFYFGSIHKRNILKRNPKGVISNFTAPAQDGLASVFGVKVDASKKILWACSSPMLEMENYDSTVQSGVFKYDLKSGKLIAKYLPTVNKNKFVFGDLYLNNKGQVYVSDSENNIIFIVNEQTGKLDEFFSSEQFWNLQGITSSDDGKYLFVADYIKGVFRLDPVSKELIQLTTEKEISLKSIDGITYYKNSLIAIQNAVTPMRVTRYALDATASKITDFKIIDRGHQAFNEPTIGCLYGDEFYYVANSLWSGYDKEHRLKPEAELQNVVILKSSLKN